MKRDNFLNKLVDNCFHVDNMYKSFAFAHCFSVINMLLLSFKALSVSVLLVLLLVYAKTSLDKLVEVRLATFVTKNVEESVRFPSITVCSGYKDSKKSPLVLANEFENHDSLDYLSHDQVKKNTFDRVEFLSPSLGGG